MAPSSLSVEQLMNRARAQEKSGDLAGAAESYRAVLARFPANKRARQGLDRLASSAAVNMGPQIDAMTRMLSGGNPAKAAELGEQLVAAGAGDLRVHELLGHARLQLGRASAAADALRKAISIDGNRPELHYTLGIALREASQPDDAVTAFRRAIRLRPGYVEAQYNMAGALRDLGQFDEAIRIYRALAPKLPKMADLQLNLGNALRGKEHYDEAAEAYEKALELNPRLAGVMVNLSSVRALEERPLEAESLLREAVTLEPDSAMIHIRLAQMVNRMGRTDEAVEHCEAALRIEPENAEYMSTLGDMLRDAGRREEAEAAYLRAADIAPDMGGPWFGWAEVHRHTAGDPNLTRIAALADNAEADVLDRIPAAFALGRAHDAIGDTDAAFARYKQANDLRAASLDYSIDEDVAMFANLKKAFPRPLKAAVTEGDDGPRPIFIVGMPRSGTSLVEQILAAHSKVRAAGELGAMRRAIHAESEDSLTHGHVPSAQALEGINERYQRSMRQLGEGKKVITDKMPLNFRWIGFIMSALPRATVLHMCRDPRAVCWSCYKSDFSNLGNRYIYDLETLARFETLHDELMAHWHALYPGQIHDVDYEALTEDPEGGIRAILRACDLDWEDACLNFHQVKRSVTTASALQVKRKMYTGSSEDWRRYESHLGPLLDGLGAR